MNVIREIIENNKSKEIKVEGFTLLRVRLDSLQREMDLASDGGLLTPRRALEILKKYRVR